MQSLPGFFSCAFCPFRLLRGRSLLRSSATLLTLSCSNEAFLHGLFDGVTTFQGEDPHRVFFTERGAGVTCFTAYDFSFHCDISKKNAAPQAAWQDGDGVISSGGEDGCEHPTRTNMIPSLPWLSTMIRRQFRCGSSSRRCGRLGGLYES